MRQRSFAQLLFIMTVVLFAAALQGVIVRADDGTAAVPTPVNRTFGVVEAYYQPQDAQTLGVTWDRVIFDWSHFQPNGPDDFNTDAIPQAYLDAAQAANREIIGLIKSTPSWASDSGSIGAVPDGLDLPFDDPDNFYGAFVVKLVTYYSQRGIHDWIILNEPDVRPEDNGNVEFQGEVEDYFHMLKVSYLAAQSVDLEAHIQVAGMQWWTDRAKKREPYLSRLLRLVYADRNAGANNYYFDGISIHLYFGTGDIWPVINANYRILQAFGLQRKEMWLDEFNASPRLDPLSPSTAPFQVTLEQQADYIIQASSLALAAGVDRLAVYRLFDNDVHLGQGESWGLVRADGSLRPAFYAYQQIIQRFSGAQSIERYKIDNGTLVTLTFPSYTLYVMWNDTFDPGQFVIHAGGITEGAVVSDADARLWALMPTEQASVPVLVIDAPPAVPTDMEGVLVSGPVRIVALAGRPRTVWFHDQYGKVIQVR
jgi:hypothetical protein